MVITMKKRNEKKGFMKKVVCIVLAFALTTGMIAGGAFAKNAEAKKAKTSPLVGSWKVTIEGLTFTYKFKKNGKGTYNAVGTKFSFKYKDKGNKVYIKYNGSDGGYTYPYKIKGKKLTIKDYFGKKITYKRV